MTPAQHAATVREGLPWLPDEDDGTQAYLTNKTRHAALDALQAQAENLRLEAVDRARLPITTRRLIERAEAAKAERDRWKGMCEYERRERDRLAARITELEAALLEASEAWPTPNPYSELARAEEKP